MSLNPTQLEILALSRTEKTSRRAKRIIPIRKNGHLLLITLLLANTLVNETLPVLLNSVFTEGYIAVVISTGCVLIFGEIIPQAICSKHGLAIGAFFAW